MKAIVIGSSAGRVKLLTKLIPKIPKYFPIPIFTVQHMPEDMPDSFFSFVSEQSQLFLWGIYAK